MKINIHSIPEGGKNIQLNPGAPWIKSMAAISLPQEKADLQTLSGSLVMDHVEDNVLLSGSLKVDLNPPCHRCGENFVYPLDVPVQMNLTPSSDEREEGNFRQKETRRRSDEETVSGEESDLNFGFHDGVEVDLQKILGELIVLSLPVRFLCFEECQGLCPKCGENLNKIKCSCKGVSPKGDSPRALKDIDPRWMGLKNFKKR